MSEEKKYRIVYEGDYKNGGYYAKYFDYLEDAFDTYAGACKRAMKNKIKANRMLIERSSDGLIFAECSVWYPPITWDECKHAHCKEALCEYRIADVRSEIEALRKKADELEKGL